MIETSCAACGKRLRVRDDAAGKRGKCPQCGAIVNLPQSDESISEAAIEGWLRPGPTDGAPRAPDERVAPAQTRNARPSLETTKSNLVPCPDCGRQVSRSAKACPNCGRPLAYTGDNAAAEAWRAKEKRKKGAKSESQTIIALLLLTLVSAIIGIIASVGGDRRSDMQECVVNLAFIAAFVFLVLLLGGLPGSIARSRGHQNASAIRLCGWIGMLFTLGVFWFVALVWAYTQPKDSTR
ncbi:MAG: DUF3302 domain-containing protein [Planctomycetes bacterium]|nr:DUF3302 domain-containing protein [Planctomycetota bacterium]